MGITNFNTYFIKDFQNKSLDFEAANIITCKRDGSVGSQAGMMICQYTQNTCLTLQRA